MKKIYFSISALLFCLSLWAQQPQGRTVSTIVADVLAQMPAQKQAEYNKQLEVLSSSGEDGVMMLVNMINAPGKGSNAQVDYALSGLTYYVMAASKEESRMTIASAYGKALELVSENEAKAFIIRQLQILGKDESVPVLSNYLNQKGLSGSAARALVGINTDKADKALLNGLKNCNGPFQKDIVLAIAEAQVADSEQTLNTLLNGSDENLQKEVLFAISKIGSKESLSAFAAFAEKAGFTLDKTGANEAYIALIKRLALLGNVKEAEVAATDLLKKATIAGKVQSRNAALEILLSIKKEDGLKLVLDALKDHSKEYRNAALSYASDFANENVYIALIKAMDKAKPDTKIDVLNWLASQSQCLVQRDNIRKLRINNNLQAMQVVRKQLMNSDFAVKEATAWTLVKLGDPNTIVDLTELLKSTDKNVVSLGQQALASFNGDITPSVVKILGEASDPGKVAGIQLLALRKSSTNLNTVLALTKSKNQEVKTAAYAALKDIVEEKDLTNMCSMLETADATNVAPLQQAIITAIAGMPKEAQATSVLTRMNQSRESNRHLYYIILAHTGETSALSIISDGFSKGQGTAKDAAFEALLSWQGYEASNVLFAICKDSSSHAYSDRALTAYIYLVSNPAFTGENRVIGLRKAMNVATNDAQKIAILRQIENTGTYLGMLYAGEFLNQKSLQQASANAVMNIALGNKTYIGDNLKALLNKVIEVLDNPDAGYQKQALKKHLEEMPAVKGFVSLFNGKDISGWKGLIKNPIARSKMKPEELAKEQVKADEAARNSWNVVDGLLVFNGKGDNLCTEKQYGDFEMYVDWMLDPAGPEADAGVYLRGTPQIQIWDTSRVNVGAQVGSGGLYNNKVNASKPLKVADNKLGEWNSFYIKMIGERVTVYLNGQLVVDDVILENYWDHSLPIFPTEQIELQAHGSKVFYRNIYVKELDRPEPFQLSADEKKEGFKVLFDGTNMYNWVGNTVDYTTENGCISMNPSKSFGGNLYTKDEYKDFVYRFEFQLTPGANNGLGIRTPMEGDAAYVGMELQILDSEHPIYKDLHAYQYHGSVYGIIPAKRGFLKPTGEWNYEEVVAKGNRIKVILNGTVIVDGDIKEATKNGTPDGKQHPGLFNEKGHIGFLGHGSPIKFRNIRVKELK
jgi:HEAT repeat protein